MSTMVSMDPTHEYLIEARLDAIERILMDSRVSRSERREILQAAENQIFEMLESRDEELSRDSVLQVLGALDPPEAYCGETPRETAGRDTRSQRLNQPPASDAMDGSVVQAGRTTSGLAIAAMVLSLLSIPTIVILPLGSLVSLAGAICGLVGMWQIAGSSGRIGGTWMTIFACVTFALHHLIVWVCFLASV